MKATYNLHTGLDLTPSSSSDASLLDRYAKAKADAEVQTRRYIISEKRTAGLDYDDRLQVRLGCGKTKAHALLNSGELFSRKIAGRRVVSESAVLRYLDPEAYTVTAQAA